MLPENLPESWRSLRRILVMRLDNIGDVVMLSPALRALKQALPEASITLMASPAGSQVAPLLPWVDEVMVQRVLWQDVSGALPLNPERELELVEKLRHQNFDAAFIFTSFSQSPYPPAYVCYLAGIPLRVGQSQAFGGGVLSQWVKPLPDTTHQVDRNLWLLESAGLTVQERHLELQIPKAVQAKSDRLLQSIGLDPQEPFVVMAPGASCESRRYPPERYALVAQELIAQTGLPVVVVGSDREIPLVDAIVQSPKRGRLLSLAGQSSIPELAGIIRRTALLIANNSGPMHFAEAFRRPMVILYSGTDWESQWQPQRSPVQLLRRPTPCSPCYQFACPYNLECLEIPPTEVVEAAVSLLPPVVRCQTEGQGRSLDPQLNAKR